MDRCNCHRDKFKLSSFDQSALSAHIMDKHCESFDKKLDNFDFGIVKNCSPKNLSRCEDFYIHFTSADTSGLNRYKATK